MPPSINQPTKANVINGAVMHCLKLLGKKSLPSQFTTFRTHLLKSFLTNPLTNQLANQAKR
jgi:hypothetical protein